MVIPNKLIIFGIFDTLNINGFILLGEGESFLFNVAILTEY